MKNEKILDIITQDIDLVKMKNEKILDIITQDIDLDVELETELQELSNYEDLLYNNIK